VSYLNTPRIHFSGGFAADPSTVNNTDANYNPATPDATVTANAEWNPNGKHYFTFENCKVQSAVSSAGAVGADDLIGGAVDLMGRLVDIDPDAQTFSQIWGGTVTVRLKSGGGSFTGKLKLCNIRDVWVRGTTPPLKGLGAVYQSVLEGVTFNTASRSPVFDSLKSSASGAGNKLSIKFNAYAYEAAPGPNFTKAKVTGTIGPFVAGEPEHFVPARKLINAGADAFGEAPFLVDSARNRLVVDLGNSVPEDPVGGARKSFGSMKLKIMVPAAPVTLGTVDYSLAHYLTTAGVEEVPLTGAQKTQLASNALAVEVSAPATRLVLQERPSGSYVDVTEMVFRLYPPTPGAMGPFSQNVATLEVFAAEFGKPKSGKTISLGLLAGTPASGLTFPASVTTGANGRASISLVGNKPGSPRGAFLDGQLYRVGVHLGAAGPSNRRAVLIVRVFDEVPAVASPTWANVEPIFRQYARLYPSMTSVFNLGAAGSLRGLLPVIKAALQRDMNAINYMPVTRDLSLDKIDMIVRWIDSGAPGIP
jgi:hypothetical protein